MVPRGCDRIVTGFTSINAISAHYHFNFRVSGLILITYAIYMLFIWVISRPEDKMVSVPFKSNGKDKHLSIMFLTFIDIWTLFEIIDVYFIVNKKKFTSCYIKRFQFYTQYERYRLKGSNYYQNWVNRIISEWSRSLANCQLRNIFSYLEKWTVYTFMWHIISWLLQIDDFLRVLEPQYDSKIMLKPIAQHNWKVITI